MEGVGVVRVAIGTSKVDGDDDIDLKATGKVLKESGNVLRPKAGKGGSARVGVALLILLLGIHDGKFALAALELSEGGLVANDQT